MEAIFLQAAARRHAALAIHDVPLDGEIPRGRSLPTAELSCSDGIHTVADSDDGIEVVVIYLADDLMGTLCLNYSGIPNSCFLADPARIKDILQMFIDCGNGDSEKVRHELLREPDCLILVADFEVVAASLRGEDQELCGGVPDLFFLLGGVVVAHAGFGISASTCYLWQNSVLLRPCDGFKEVRLNGGAFS